MGMFCLEFKPRLAHAIFAYQADAIGNEHELSKCTLAAAFARLGAPYILVSVNGQADEKASIHRYYRYMKGMAVVRLTH